jgi:hypothetical protein
MRSSSHTPQLQTLSNTRKSDCNLEIHGNLISVFIFFFFFFFFFLISNKILLIKKKQQVH